MVRDKFAQLTTMSLTSQHAYHSLIPDILTIIFQYHIFKIPTPISHYSRCDISFLQKFIRAVSFGLFYKIEWPDEESPEMDVLKVLLRGKRNNSLTYLDVSHSRTLCNETFTYFRGIQEIHLNYTASRAYDHTAFENLREARIVHMKGVGTFSTQSIFENLRNVHTLHFEFGSLDPRREDFENLRQCKRLVLNKFKGGDEELQNFRGAEEIVMDYGSIIRSPDALKFFCGAHRVHIRWHSEWDLSVLENFRGIEDVQIHGLFSITAEATANFRCVKQLRIPSCMIQPGCLQHLRGVQVLWVGSVEKVSADEFENLFGIEELRGSRLTDDMIRHLRGLKTLIASTPLFSDQALGKLTSLEVIRLHYMASSLLTDAGLYPLRNLRRVTLQLCRCMQGAFLQHLHQVHEVTINRTVLTEESSPYFAGIPSIYFENTQVHRSLFRHISGVKHFYLGGGGIVGELTDDDLPMLKACFSEASVVYMRTDSIPSYVLKDLMEFVKDRKRKRLLGEVVSEVHEAM